MDQIIQLSTTRFAKILRDGQTPIKVSFGQRITVWALDVPTLGPCRLSVVEFGDRPEDDRFLDQDEIAEMIDKRG